MTKWLKPGGYYM